MPTTTSVFDQDLLDGEALSNFRAGLGRCVDEQLVEHRPPGAVRDRRVRRARRPGEREGTEIERVGVHRRTSGRRQPIDQSPSCEGRGAQWMHHVRGHRVARERRAVDHEHTVSLAGQQHRRRRTRAARSHDDRVVCRIHVCPLTSWCGSEPRRVQRDRSGSHVQYASWSRLRIVFSFHLGNYEAVVHSVTERVTPTRGAPRCNQSTAASVVPSTPGSGR